MLRRAGPLLLLTCVVGCGALLGVGADDDEDEAPPATESDASSGDLDGAEGDTTVSLGGDAAAEVGLGTKKDASSDAAKDADAKPANAGACNGSLACARYVFVTAATYPGTFDAATADEKCREAADRLQSKAEMKGRFWQAWISTPTKSASQHVVHGNNVYKRSDDQVVADNYLDLTTKNLQATISIDEAGASIATESVWTGSNADGSYSGFGCSAFASATASGGTVGDTTSIDSQWTNAGILQCTASAHLYCFEY